MSTRSVILVIGKKKQNRNYIPVYVFKCINSQCIKSVMWSTQNKYILARGNNYNNKNNYNVWSSLILKAIMISKVVCRNFCDFLVFFNGK